MRILASWLMLLLLASPGCPASGNPKPPAGPRPVGQVQGATPAAADEPAAARFTPRAKIKPGRLVWAYVDGVRKAMDVDEARSLGLTIVDLSDDWVPYIFWSQSPGKDDYSPNAYLDTFIELANDRIDGDGVALEKHQRNYLEVYGIPPTLGVLRKRFLDDEKNACFKDLKFDLFDIDFEQFKRYRAIRITSAAGSRRELKRWRRARTAFKKALRKARVKTLEQLEKKGKYRTVANNWRRYRWRHQAIIQMQKRMACEKMFGKRKVRIKPAIIDWNILRALRRFERKHNIYGWGQIFYRTIPSLGRTPTQNNYESLKRVFTERVVSAARILEDGTIKYYRDANNKRVRQRNLVQEFSTALLTQMGLTDEHKALAFIKQYKNFKHMWVAVKLPPVPAYYSDHMELSMVIDRGDVWYDFPNKFDAGGRLRPKPRSKFPHQTLYVTHKDQKIPLIRWRTTIGSWQPEMKHDQEYYKYKISDVGPRIWKNIIAGPVWVPPRSTPSRDMVKIRPVRGRSERIVAHNSFGPGFASAYGLVAAFHVTKSGRDNQVRTHGSANYMSINSASGFSHGCHRLHNYRAVRLFSFVLAHRKFKREGQRRLHHGPRFEHRGEQYGVDIRTRGYYYEMTPPVPVNVLEGNIRGEAQDPIEKPVKKPTLMYQEDLPSLRRKKTIPGQRKKNGGGMNQPQNL